MKKEKYQSKTCDVFIGGFWWMKWKTLSKLYNVYNGYKEWNSKKINTNIIYTCIFWIETTYKQQDNNDFTTVNKHKYETK